MIRSFMRLIFVYGCVALVAPATTTTSSMDEDYSNETGAASYELYNGTNCENFLSVVNSSVKRCVNQEEFVSAIYEYIYPRPYEWLLVAMHCLVFVVGLVGNFMVCMAIYRNHTMRNVTNYFIVNLAVADLLVIIVCLPPTVVWDVTETWFFGMIPCKIVLYFQTVSVTVSVLTLAFISLDRWYAICYPLRFKSTTSRAKSAIVVIWVIALVLDIPELVVLQTVSVHGNKTHLMTQCTYNMTDAQILGFIIFKFVVLYVMPLAFIIFAYCQIIRVLWRSDIPGHNLSTRMLHSNEITSQANIGTPAESQLKSRRKASKMLVAVVLLFAICCFPVHLMGILRYTMNFTTEDVPIWVISSCIFHWLLYLNSAINPVIYNFMSGKFRQEFKRTFCCPSDGGAGSSHGGGRAGAYRKVKNHHQLLTSRSMRTTCSNFNIRTNTLVNCNNNFHLSSEAIPLSTVCVTTAAAAVNNQQQQAIVQQNCFKER
ncbi:orexin receptor type 1-like [Trichogramma pretiosum]|uniref:orexin receptor type 1-like n=1 Tax=Trichogramma pretiosum TaxID=7493 RepID=UPI0006C9B524|nr:orexin receptor type 1-like [Trichogramma pretiosum]XP_023316832.1 orexin receptor type 1-like [Trichogramma pretiosum]